MKRAIIAALVAVAVIAVVLVVLVVIRSSACWGVSIGGGPGVPVTKTAPSSDDTAEYWTEERRESATGSPMPSC